MKKKMVFWCLFFGLCFFAGYMNAAPVKTAYFDYLENKFEKWQENETIQKMGPYGGKVCLMSFSRGGGYGYIEITYYANCPLFIDGKRIRYDEDIPKQTERFLKLWFSPSPSVRYRQADDRDYYEYTEELREKNEDY